jgi:hypothetical protein
VSQLDLDLLILAINALGVWIEYRMFAATEMNMAHRIAIERRGLIPDA